MEEKVKKQTKVGRAIYHLSVEVKGAWVSLQDMVRIVAQGEPMDSDTERKVKGTLAAARNLVEKAKLGFILVRRDAHRRVQAYRWADPETSQETLGLIDESLTRWKQAGERAQLRVEITHIHALVSQQEIKRLCERSGVPFWAGTGNEKGWFIQGPMPELSAGKPAEQRRTKQ